MNLVSNNGMGKNAGGEMKTSFRHQYEITDPSTLNYELTSDNNEEDGESENSDSSSYSSLPPYDLTDDGTVLKRKYTHLTDVIGGLRKSDDADGADRALPVVEKLARASLDKCTNVAGDLVRTLVQGGMPSKRSICPKSCPFCCFLCIDVTTSMLCGIGLDQGNIEFSKGL